MCGVFCAGSVHRRCADGCVGCAVWKEIRNIAHNLVLFLVSSCCYTCVASPMFMPVCVCLQQQSDQFWHIQQSDQFWHIQQSDQFWRIQQSDQFRRIQQSDQFWRIQQSDQFWRIQQSDQFWRIQNTVKMEDWNWLLRALGCGVFSSENFKIF